MRCIILALTRSQGEQWLMAVENWGECWQGQVCLTAAEAYQALQEAYAEVCLLCPCPEAHALEQLLVERPLLSPPWVIGAGECLPTGLPPGMLASMERLTCLARGLLHALTASCSLRAAEFLPDMAALAVAHPPLLDNLRTRLYPLVARRHGTTPAAVERSLRTLVEATWNHGDLAALERFFGHSIDPERGKPTNKEFLCRLQERLTLAGQRFV